MSVPAGLANGLPVGMHLVAGDFAESRLLNVAHQFQPDGLAPFAGNRLRGGSLIWNGSRYRT